MSHKLTIAFTRREAELYRSQGLLEEAQRLYGEVLTESADLGDRLAQSLQNQIRKIEEELVKLDVDLREVVSDRDLEILKESWGDAHTPVDILNCAISLGDIGLHEAACDEYLRLIRLQHPFREYLQSFMDCLLSLHPPSEIEKVVEDIIRNDLGQGCKPANLRAACAVDLERRGYYKAARGLLQAVRSEVPDSSWVEDKLRALEVKLQSRPAPSSKIADPPQTLRAAYFHRRIDRLRRHLQRIRALLRGLGR
jgi:tetratricopeptide (TPR) repeat protein